jgi:3-oxoacyl-[acyl-carrier-protein] synthase II
MYIRATGNISPQPSFNQLLNEPVVYTSNRLTAIEPDYSKIVDPKLIRRMSRIIKMGVAASMECLKDADNNHPGAIITGTAYGCLADTESFLGKMVENKEELLTPTAFIQSTHNTVGAQIALMLKCHNYNNTFVHRGFSFESALLDAITLMNDDEAATVLVGGVDEITTTSHTILSRFGLYRNGAVSTETMFDSDSKGTVNGEGAAFFLLGKNASGNDYAQLKGMHTFYKPTGLTEVEKNINDFLSSAAISIGDIDLIITGRNGDQKNDEMYNELSASIFRNKEQINYKYLCGEYPTSSAFALWLAANIIKSGKVPALSTVSKPSSVLIYNSYLGIHHSLYLLSVC